MAIGSKLLDSSVWLRHLFDDKYIEIIEKGETNFISVLSLFEIKRKLLTKIEKGESLRIIEQIKRRSIMLDVTSDIAEKAAEIAFQNKIPMADSIIYVTARENRAVLITADNDFRGLEGVEVLE